jgi:hypothetical protein
MKILQFITLFGLSFTSEAARRKGTMPTLKDILSVTIDTIIEDIPIYR